MNPWRRLPADPPTSDEIISPEDIAWRIGAAEVKPAHHDPEEAAALATVATEGIGAEPRDANRLRGSAPTSGRASAATSGAERRPLVAPVLQSRPLVRPAHTVPRAIRASGRADHAHEDRMPRRLTLWRDVSALLFGAVAIALIAQFAVGNRGHGSGAGSAPGRTSVPSPVPAEASPTPRQSAAVTLGPVVNPSLIPAILATPRLRPATPAPTPDPTPRPASPTITSAPSPTPIVTVSPTALPTPTSAPSALVSITRPGAR